MLPTRFLVLLLTLLTWGPRGGCCGTAGEHRRSHGVCGSVDARNNVESLVHALQDCQVVEGYIHMIDVGSNDTGQLEKLSFPKLREISEHLILYRVRGLRSLAHLFPNLAVIRGNSLIWNYTLVVYNVSNLQDVALPKLTVIAQGSVYIQGNPSLCYVNTIDWGRIVKSDLGKSELRLREGRMTPCSQTCPEHCADGDKKSRCWNEHFCQRSKCPARCGEAPCFIPHTNSVSDALATETSPQNRVGTSSSLECCHKECLSDCWGPGAHQCYSCRNVIHNKSCEASCPPHLVRIHSRCITIQECLHVPSSQDDVDFNPRRWRVFNATCVANCPQGHEEYEDVNGLLTCRNYKIVCSSSKVDSIAKARDLEGCTHINTSLEIQIDGRKEEIEINGRKDVSVQLEKYLGSIEQIDGYLKITKSFSLLNLNFLKNLSVIHGKVLEKNKYSLIVLDNQNLQELWDWKTRENGLQLANGTIFFHFNPQLCPREIQRLQQTIKLPTGSFSELDVSNTTNGDEVECDVVNLTARVTTKLVSGVILEWEVLTVPKHNYILGGYLVYSIEAPVQNVMAYDARGVCGGNDWRVDDVPTTATDDEIGPGPRGINQILTCLKPNTQYAFYVKTYSLTTLSHYGGQSPIQYFTTLPSRPSPPVNLRALSRNHSELRLEWSPPVNPNGHLSHYLVVGQWIPDDQAFLLGQRDYCVHPMEQDHGASNKSPHVVSSMPAGSHHQPCWHGHHVTQAPSYVQDYGGASLQSEDCLTRCRTLASMATRAELDKEDWFTSYMHELSYQEELNYTQSAQETFPQDEAFDMRKKNESRDPAGSPNVTVDGLLHEFSFTVPAHLNYVIAKPLLNFGLYSIQVWACRQPHPEEPVNAERCSAANQISVRTAPDPAFDKVTAVNATVIGPSEVKLIWMPPAKPNGLILAFHVLYKREGNFQFPMKCLSVRPHTKPEEELTYKLDSLLAGTYFVKIRTISLAGDESISKEIKFIIYNTIDSDRAGAVKKSILITLASFIPIIGAICILYWRQRRHKMEAEDVCLIASVNPDYVSANYTEDEWELVRDRVTLIRELGQGSFGMVYEGELTPEGSGPPIPCAIKTMNESANCRERLQFLHEASVMKAFNAHHVVRLLGVVSRGQPTLVVMELMTRGDLKTYLRSSRDTGEPSPIRQLQMAAQMAAQIADGMLYLSTKKFVHRDLAARNCMVSQDLTVKIGDFGMTRDIYETDYYRKGSKGLLPVRWMAPESLHDGVFTSSSDVWSYGMVLWEMATHAEQPYQGQSNEQVLQQILSGNYLTPPSDCPEVLAILMEACWQRSPLARPTFTNLLERLLPLIPSDFAHFSFYHRRDNNTETHQSRPILEPSSNGVAMHFLS